VPSLTPAPPPHFAEYRANSYTISIPDNWKQSIPTERRRRFLAGRKAVFVDEAVAIAPRPYGLIIGVGAGPREILNGWKRLLNGATSQVIQDLQKSNPSMKITRRGERLRL